MLSIIMELEKNKNKKQIHIKIKKARYKIIQLTENQPVFKVR